MFLVYYYFIFSSNNVFEPSYNDLKFMLRNSNYVCTKLTHVFKSSWGNAGSDSALDTLSRSQLYSSDTTCEEGKAGGEVLT